MPSSRTMLLAAAAVLGPILVLSATAARADDYTDLLDVLRAKGSLTKSEYRTLLAKHTHHGAMSEDAAAAHQAAMQAAASAAAAQQVMAQTQAEMQKGEAMMASPDIVHAMPYKPGAGITMKVGNVDLNISGIVNAFYTYGSGDSNIAAHQVAGGLTDASGFDSSSVRNGLLPGALIISAATQQEGIDLTAVFGVYPGINSASVGALNANNGGNATALGTAGVDFRKTYITAGTPNIGTFKLGRDIGLFGQDAILNDQTLLGVGATGGNADPANTSLGRIGLGYIYADFMPQITYISPVFAGFQASVGIFQPLNAISFAGSYTQQCGEFGPCFDGTLPYSQSSGEHSAPMFQGRFTYDYKSDVWSAHLWAGFVAQSLDNIAQATGGTESKTGVAGEGGATITVGPVGVTGYYYRGSGVGTTGLFFDAIGANGQLRDSEGGYIQAFWKPVAKLKLIASYGVSSLYLANGEGAYDSYNLYTYPSGYTIQDPAANLVRRNESETGGAYYSLTDWLTLVGEYTHSDSHSHGTNQSSADSVSLGAILFY